MTIGRAYVGVTNERSVDRHTPKWVPAFALRRFMLWAPSKDGTTELFC